MAGQHGSRGLSRRVAMQRTLASTIAALMPRLAFADEATLADALKKLYRGKAVHEGRIRLDVPPIAENGLVVPIHVEVESPMTEADHVKSVHVFADGNPLPGVVSYRFTPACGKAGAATRIRLAQSQNVVCVAEMSNGDLFTAKAAVKITIGGCGG
jgi:sulfur-oxidizing protein SoxY